MRLYRYRVQFTDKYFVAILEDWCCGTGPLESHAHSVRLIFPAEKNTTWKEIVSICALADKEKWYLVGKFSWGMESNLVTLVLSLICAVVSAVLTDSLQRIAFEHSAGMAVHKWAIEYPLWVCNNSSGQRSCTYYFLKQYLSLRSALSRVYRCMWWDNTWTNWGGRKVRLLPVRNISRSSQTPWRTASKRRRSA